jgi:hypothetical protein
MMMMMIARRWVRPIACRLFLTTVTITQNYLPEDALAGRGKCGNRRVPFDL